MIYAAYVFMLVHLHFTQKTKFTLFDWVENEKTETLEVYK